MSQDVFEMMQKMNLHSVETQMAIQCAPVFAGLKMSNLLIVAKEDICKVRQILKSAVISWHVVSMWKEKATILLYREEELKQYLNSEAVYTRLQGMGYEGSLESKLERFSQRYQAYQAGQTDFPHEMGFLLGYPVEDVEGFIRNGGENSLYTGDWKVYDNLTEKLQLFSKFEVARESLLGMVSAGTGIVEIMRNKRLQQPVA